jgi:hypothetical protein
MAGLLPGNVIERFWLSSWVTGCGGGTCGTRHGEPAASRGDLGHCGPVGKGRHIRTVPVPNWVKETFDTWLAAAGIESGPLFRCVCRAGKLWGNELLATPRAPPST